MKIFNSIRQGVKLCLVMVLLFIASLLKAQTPDTLKKVSVEFSGNIKADYRYFLEEGIYSGQEQHYLSAAIEPDIYIEWDKGKKIIQFTSFARLDQHDSKRTHFDIRELYWLNVFKKWEFSIGLKKIFWGVVESNHLVDIINQTDFVESFNGDQKLGQPMVHLSFPGKWGTLDFFVLPYFRPLLFPGNKGRLRPPLDIGNKNPAYESELEEFNPDLAIRWFHRIGIFDIGLSHFYGTSRIPVFIITDFNNIPPPYYEIINRTGVELQTSTGPVLWKLEGIYRQSKRKTNIALAAGGEYTLSNIFNSGIDIGILGEYSLDERGAEAFTILDDDFFVGSRIALNDRQSTELLMGAAFDRTRGSRLFSVEGSRRIGNSWKVNIEARIFDNIDTEDFLYFIRKDSFMQLRVSKYF